MKLSQLEKRIQQTLPNSRDIIQKWPKLLAPKWPDRIGARGKQMRPEHCINEIHPGCPGVTFPMTHASIMPEVSLPRWKDLYIWIFSGKHAPGPPYSLSCPKNNSTPPTVLLQNTAKTSILAKWDRFSGIGLKKILGIKGHSSATYGTFARHLFYKPNRKNIAILIGIPNTVNKLLKSDPFTTSAIQTLLSVLCLWHPGSKPRLQTSNR